jgi:2-succinyl-5-enolpyruvyl-6-hydroxy-3-cyclohexene-1-carboxylate synthase
MKLTLKSLQKIYFCTGARNHDLLKSFEESSLSFEFDERMASFKALGLSKQSLAPVAVCTTSGTAVSECLSAMLEAQYSKSPLVLITGDRPKKQHGSGAPQTINHEALTSGARGSFYEVTLSELPHLEIDDPVYPVHINVLVDDTIAHKAMIVRHDNLIRFEEMLGMHKSPLFLISHEEKSMREFVLEFSRLKIPFYAETMSGAHDLSMIKTEKELLKLYRAGFFDCVIRIGFTPLSKIWRLMELKLMPVMSFDSRNLPGLSYGEIYPASSEGLLNNGEWWSIVKKVSSPFRGDDSLRDLRSLMAKYPQAEISTFARLQEHIPERSHVYLGNSLVIRNFELTQTRNYHVHGSRGVNGIDGQLATAIGIATGMQETLYCILGDITTLYDLTSLREMPKNLKVVIMNNKGGRIFDMLKLDKRIVLEHEFHFASICQAFGLSYAQKQVELLSDVQVLELFPDRHESESLLKEWSL